ncbi:Rrf2 family transcriptional regulator [bacterium]|nr:Rrf2 family transcriptional regulator [bacterium]
MRTTTKGLYALRAMVALAADSSRDNPLALRAIADSADISAEFLQQIFFNLRKAGLVAAYRGPGGGFFLLKDKSEIDVLSILEAAGESIELSPCSEAREDGEPSFAGVLDRCAGQFWNSLERQVRDYASSRTLADLLEREGEAPREGATRRRSSRK